jgi:predicted MPP superfamily phosphohydrolase
MANRMFMFKMFLVVFTLLVDIYVFIAILSLLKDQSSLIKLLTTIVFWGVTATFLIAFVFVIRFDSGQRDPAGLSGIFLLVGIYSLVYLPKLVFLIFRGAEDIIWAGSFTAMLGSKLFNGVSLSTVRLPVISMIGLVVSVIPFIAILWGLVFGRFHYQVEEVEIKFHNLPKSLEGLTIVQLSDIHLGSVYGKEKKVQKALEIVNDLQPDLIMFTGDLVNNFTEEAHGWEELFATLRARYGKFSILGNHDYGEYWEWKSEHEKTENMRRLFDVHRDMGFKLLRNAWDTLRINGELLAVVGVENWGQPPFKQYGDLEKSLRNVPDDAFKILLSHDPSHWDAQVAGYTDIPLTLSGHTHAMQFGVKLGKFRWSPSKYIYKRWMGLYRRNNQALYVNRGLGFIGFPGRIGLRPEITLITLKRSTD